MNEQKIKTNADRIRAMTDEELAKILVEEQIVCGIVDYPCAGFDNCEECCLGWLRSPVDGSEK